MQQTTRTTTTDARTPRQPRRTEFWELLHDRFPGATVLEDLENSGDNEEAARWIVVRYAAVRVAASLLADVPDDRELRIERNIGLNHLRAVPMLDREAWSLRRMLESITSSTPVQWTLDPLMNAADCAAARGHVRGAYAMCHIAYRIAVPRGWYAEAARAARTIEVLSREAGAVYSPRLWRRRARTMAQRAAVA